MGCFGVFSSYFAGKVQNAQNAPQHKCVGYAKLALIGAGLFGAMALTRYAMDNPAAMSAHLASLKARTQEGAEFVAKHGARGRAFLESKFSEARLYFEGGKAARIPVGKPISVIPPVSSAVTGAFGR